MWQAFINLLIWILEAIQGLVGDWGIAIILLTIAIRLIITPLQARSYSSNAKMQALQPKLQELQDKYQDDPERLAAEMRTFYAENSFNPLGGCLPVLIQMPVFFALYRALLNGIPTDATLLGVMQLSLSPTTAIAELGVVGALGYILFDLGFAVLTLIPMLLNQSAAGQNEDARRQSIIMGVTMSVMMGFVGWRLPVGILLYYVVSSLWGVIQQRVVTRRVTAKVQAEIAEREAAAAAKGPQITVERREHKARQHKKK